MTSQATEISATLVDRVCERAARALSAAEIPLIVLEEMQADGLHHRRDAPVESAKILLVAAHQSAHGSNCLSREEAFAV